MKKVICILIFTFIALISSAQVKNMKGFLVYSELSVNDLNKVLEQTWEIKNVIRHFSDDSTMLVERYTYALEFEKGVQVLQRIIIRNLLSDETSMKTSLMFNDLSLMKEFKSSVTLEGFIKIDDLKYANNKNTISLHGGSSNSSMLAENQFFILIE